MKNRLSRRGFVALLTGFVAAAGVSCSRILNGLLQGDVTAAPTQTPPSLRVTSEPIPSETFDEPLPTEEPVGVGGEHPEATLPPQDKEDFGPRVVHVHAPSSTSWTGRNPEYWNYIDQGVVDEMVDRGVMTLTGASGVADAWRAILPNYQPGQGIAIKVNFNNSNRCDNTSGSPIDALIEPVNVVVRGLKQIGVVETDIWVYDAIRSIPDRFSKGCQYNGVQFYDKGFPGGCGIQGGFKSADPDAYVTFHPPQGTPVPSPVKITDVLINATYVINMPIMKYHGDGVGVSLSFKNHFGSIDQPENLHDYIVHNFQYYSPGYSPFVDLYNNPHIVNKTIITIGDGLFACKERRHFPPSLWSTFGNQVPSSLFFATDPVAVDCVMSDFIAAERLVPEHADDYLRLASLSGLGIFQRGDPWGPGYNQIDYLTMKI